MSKILYTDEFVALQKEKLKEEIKTFERCPTLAIVVAKDCSQASNVYVRNKFKMASDLGILVVEHIIEWDSTKESELALEDKLKNTIEKLNADNLVDGIIVQLPFYQISDDYISSLIDQKKDVDGFSLQNLGATVRGNFNIAPCTPLGAMEFLKYCDIKISGKVCCIVGRSNILGKPLANMLINEGGTVISCNSRTVDLRAMTSMADIVFLATGNAKKFDETYFKKGSIVIDFGMNRDENNKLCGDLDVENTQDILQAYTPTPKGTGPLTVLTLMKNTTTAYKINCRKK